MLFPFGSFLVENVYCEALCDILWHPAWTEKKGHHWIRHRVSYLYKECHVCLLAGKNDWNNKTELEQKLQKGFLWPSRVPQSCFWREMFYIIHWNTSSTVILVSHYKKGNIWSAYGYGWRMTVMKAHENIWTQNTLFTENSTVLTWMYFPFLWFSFLSCCRFSFKFKVLLINVLIFSCLYCKTLSKFEKNSLEENCISYVHMQFQYNYLSSESVHTIIEKP